MGVRNVNKQFVILYFNIFLVFLGIGLVVPVLPVYLKDLGLKGSDLGVLVAVFALAQNGYFAIWWDVSR